MADLGIQKTYLKTPKSTRKVREPSSRRGEGLVDDSQVIRSYYAVNGTRQPA